MPLKRKTAIECKIALQSIIKNLNFRGKNKSNTMKPKFCSTNWAIILKAEKIWIDNGREFSGQFSEYCTDNIIQIYSTHSETKSAFAVRNIRSLKAILFKYLHENNTDTYVENLQQFVDVINSRVNRFTKLALKEVRKCDVPYLISLQNTNTPLRPKIHIGQQMRIKQKISRGYRIQFTANTEPSHLYD